MVRARSPAKNEAYDGRNGVSSANRAIFALETIVNCGQLIANEVIHRSVKIYCQGCRLELASQRGNLFDFKQETEDKLITIRFSIKVRGTGDALVIKAGNSQLSIPVYYKIATDLDTIRRIRIQREKRRQRLTQSGNL